MILNQISNKSEELNEFKTWLYTNEDVTNYLFEKISYLIEEYKKQK